MVKAERENVTQSDQPVVVFDAPPSFNVGDLLYIVTQIPNGKYFDYIPVLGVCIQLEEHTFFSNFTIKTKEGKEHNYDSNSEVISHIQVYPKGSNPEIETPTNREVAKVSSKSSLITEKFSSDISGEDLKLCRALFGRSQESLATVLGLNKRQLIRYENDQQPIPKTITLAYLALLLSIGIKPPETLLSALGSFTQVMLDGFVNASDQASKQIEMVTDSLGIPFEYNVEFTEIMALWRNLRGEIKSKIIHPTLVPEESLEQTKKVADAVPPDHDKKQLLKDVKAWRKLKNANSDMNAEELINCVKKQDHKWTKAEERLLKIILHN